MNERDIEAISAWATAQGLAGMSEVDLLAGFCERCTAAGIALSRALVIVDTLHPIYEGRAFRWRSYDPEPTAVIEFGRTDEGEAAESWRRSTFYHLLETGVEEMRRRIGLGDAADFSQLVTLREEGEMDYLAFVHRLGTEASIGGMDCIYSSWMTRDPAGFDDADVAALRRLLPQLELAIKAGSLARIAGTLVEVYLGRDAGQRVLSGRIARGVADRIGAVLWFSDLRGYTALTESAPPDEIIPLLNDYSDAVISSVHEAGGDVLKLIGDGTLAIFKAESAAEACRAALSAAAELRRRQRVINERRRADGRPVTFVYLALHIGEVLYGNIGSEDRLDFTVVGPAVNEVSRIASMCRSVDRSVVFSSDFAAATPDPERAGLVSVGRYALRGVGRSQELFTLDPALLHDED